MICVNGKVSPLNEFTRVTNYSIHKAKENLEKKKKAYYEKDERGTLVNIFVGGTFPFTHVILFLCILERDNNISVPS